MDVRSVPTGRELFETGRLLFPIKIIRHQARRRCSKEIMRHILSNVSDRLSVWMEVVAGIALIGVMLLIGCDILGRIYGRPVPGAYEMVSLAGGLIIGLALPATSRAYGHVSTDLLLEKLSETPKRILAVITRFIGITIFLLAGYGMVRMGIRLRYSGEVTAVLAFPFYYAAYVISGAFFIQAMVQLSQIYEAINPNPKR
jgi:TRAP-type C4-dicarboxylate transport system permease small subunit